jgi:hypothetical protein
MLDVALHWWKDGLFDPVARLLPAIVTPGHITLVAFVCGLLSCVATINSIHKPTSVYRGSTNRFLTVLTVRWHGTGTLQPLGGRGSRPA